MFSCIPYIVGWFIAMFSISVVEIYISRLFVGASQALLTTSIYLVEMSSPELRASFNALNFVSRYVGVMLIYCLAIYMRWKTIAYFAPVIPFLALIWAYWFSPESPVFLIANKR